MRSVELLHAKIKVSFKLRMHLICIISWINRFRARTEERLSRYPCDCDYFKVFPAANVTLPLVMEDKVRH